MPISNGLKKLLNYVKKKFSFVGAVGNALVHSINKCREAHSIKMRLMTKSQNSLRKSKIQNIKKVPVFSAMTFRSRKKTKVNLMLFQFDNLTTNGLGRSCIIHSVTKT